ncbi:hypothetical protein TNCV_1464731 [Trichonephila clavipes]|nr:hypothetical protein TNCV_1464731 [Trichonephila clavipes]
MILPQIAELYSNPINTRSYCWHLQNQGHAATGYGLLPQAETACLQFADVSKMTATAGSDVVQSGRPIFDDFFQHLWPYIGNNTANVVFQMVKRLWLIRIDH